MARKTKVAAEKTRNLIMESAEILFYEKGVSSTSLADIAAHAGLTRGAIYWHFKNKVDLFNALHWKIRLPLENMQAETLNQPNPVDALRDFWIRSILNVLGDVSRRRIIEILFRKCEYVKEFEDAASRLENWSNYIISKMTEIFSEADRKNLLREGVSPEVAAMYTYSVITGVMYSLMNDSYGEQVGKRVPDIINIFFQTISRTDPDASDAGPVIDLPLAASGLVSRQPERKRL